MTGRRRRKPEPPPRRLPLRFFAARQSPPEVGRRQYRHRKHVRERQEIGVAGHQRVGAPGQRQFQERGGRKDRGIREPPAADPARGRSRRREGSRRAGRTAPRRPARIGDRQGRGRVRPRSPGWQAGGGRRERQAARSHESAPEWNNSADSRTFVSRTGRTGVIPRIGPRRRRRLCRLPRARARQALRARRRRG